MTVYGAAALQVCLWGNVPSDLHPEYTHRVCGQPAVVHSAFCEITPDFAGWPLTEVVEFPMVCSDGGM